MVWFDIKVVEIEIRTKFNIFKTNVNINRSSDGKEKNVFTKLIVGILVVNVNQMFVSLSRDFFNFGLQETEYFGISTECNDKRETCYSKSIRFSTKIVFPMISVLYFQTLNEV